MKLIEDDLGLRKMFSRSFEKGWTHIHSDGLDLGRITPMFAQRLSKAAQCLGTAAFDHQQQPPAVTIQHVSHIAVSPPGAGLIGGNAALLPPVAFSLPFLNLKNHPPPQTRIGLAQ